MVLGRGAHAGAPTVLGLALLEVSSASLYSRPSPRPRSQAPALPTLTFPASSSTHSTRFCPGAVVIETPKDNPTSPLVGLWGCPTGSLAEKG